MRRLRDELADDPEALRAAIEAWWAQPEGVTATVAQVADHIDHVREVAGIDHVGVGGDYDGVTTAPEGLEDVSTYPALFEELAGRGYGDEDLRKVAGRNVLRVMRETERVSERLQRERPPSRATLER
jgi:membrane dipeptidase